MTATSTRIVAALFVVSGLAGVGEARAPVLKAEAVIAAAKRATGGGAWDKPQGCIEEDIFV